MSHRLELSEARGAEMRRRSPGAFQRYVLVFLVLAGALLCALRLDWTWRAAREPYCRLLADLSARVAALYLSGVSLQGHAIHVAGGEGMVFTVVRGCDALEPLALLLSAVVAFPASWKARSLAMAACTLCLSLFNLARLQTLILLGTHWPRIFEVIHVYVFQTSVVICAALLFTAWTGRQ